MTELERLAAAYEQAEAAFLTAIRTRAPRAAAATTASNAAAAATAFNTEAYRKLHAAEDDAWAPLDHLTERTELLSELWADLAAAYHD
jgi:hypothetical protein